MILNYRNNKLIDFVFVYTFNIVIIDLSMFSRECINENIDIVFDLQSINTSDHLPNQH
jgi:hypothetical protein